MPLWVYQQMGPSGARLGYLSAGPEAFHKCLFEGLKQVGGESGYFRKREA